MDLISVHPIFNMYNHDWPIHTWPGITQPAKFIFDEDGRRGQALDSMVCAGVVISGGTVRRSILSPLAHLHSLLAGRGLDPHARGRGRPQRGRAAGDPRQERLHRRGRARSASTRVKDRERFHVSDGGIVVIPKGMRVTE